MIKIIPLSLILTISAFAIDVELTPISVESTLITEVSQNAQVSADLAQALSSSAPSIDMNRRSGIANDIYIRGQKRDNISVEVDGTKVQGACVNRMDPPISHILTNQIQEIEIIEGPYDVETFGTLSGGVKITTKKPQEGFSGSIDFGLGGFNYKKASLSLSGGNDIVRVLISGSSESSDMYKDGNGDTIAEQIDAYAETNPSATGTKYQTQYKDMQAYDKKSLMAKAFVTVTDNQELRLSYTANRSDDILYGNSKMDALYDDSDIYSVEYDIKNINDIYKNANIQYYYSSVDHPMSTKYRLSSAGTNPIMTNWLSTSMKGLKFKNSFEIANHIVEFGLDASERVWDGNYYKDGVIFTNGVKSIDNAVTDNRAIFAKVKKELDALEISVGIRYDSTEITHATEHSNDYSSFGANLMATLNINNENKIFLGVGQASRVPDARELYFRGSKGNWTGTPDLVDTTNTEIDLGYEINSNNLSFKIKAFYSMLKDYIYYNTNNTIVLGDGSIASYHAFENIDAIIYGTELSASVYATDEISVDMSISYKVGKKDEAMETQTDTDLADIAPLRGDIALNYEYMHNSVATLELQASDKWDVIDEDNGEQKLDSWSIVNLKVKHSFNKNIDFTLGVNNLFDKTYALSNTYADLILITAGGSSDIMLMNEPGRYVYTNLTLKF